MEPVQISYRAKTPLPNVTDDTIAEILEDLTQGRNAIMTAYEVAMIIGRSYRQTLRIIHGENPLTTPQYIRLALAIFDRGDKRLLEIATPVGYTIAPITAAETNNSVDDELGDMTEFEGKMREAFNQGDVEKAQYWQSRAKEAQNRIDAEIENLKRHTR